MSPRRSWPGPWSERFAALCRFEAERARALLGRGLPLAGALGGRIGRSVALFARGGLAALDALEESGWDVFTQRPAPGRLTFVRLAAGELLRPSARERPTRRRAGSPAARRGASRGGSVSCRLASGRRSQRSTPSRVASTTSPTIRGSARRSAGRAWSNAGATSRRCPSSPNGDLVLLALADAVARFRIPTASLTDLVDGGLMDVERTRYESWDELREYCRRVAGAVGIACCAVYGPDDQAAAFPSRDAGPGSPADQHHARRGRGLAARPRVPPAGRAGPLRRLRGGHRGGTDGAGVEGAHGAPGRARRRAPRRGVRAPAAARPAERARRPHAGGRVLRAAGADARDRLRRVRASAASLGARRRRRRSRRCEGRRCRRRAGRARRGARPGRRGPRRDAARGAADARRCGADAAGAGRRSSASPRQRPAHRTRLLHGVPGLPRRVGSLDRIERVPLELTAIDEHGRVSAIRSRRARASFATGSSRLASGSRSPGRATPGAARRRRARRARRLPTSCGGWASRSPRSIASGTSSSARRSTFGARRRAPRSASSRCRRPSSAVAAPTISSCRSRRSARSTARRRGGRSRPEPTVRLRARVAAVDGEAAVLADGERVDGDAFVVALPPEESAEVLAEPPPGARGLADRERASALRPADPAPAAGRAARERRPLGLRPRAADRPRARARAST